MTGEIRVIVFESDNMFIAQCLEVDVAAQGKTEEEALRRLKVVLRLEIKEAEARGGSVLDLGPAPAGMTAIYESATVHRHSMVA